MAALSFPTDKQVGYVHQLPNGMAWKLASTNPIRWEPIPRYTGNSAVGLSTDQVTQIAQTVANAAAAAAVNAANIGGQIDTKIAALKLGTLATANAYVSTAAPDNSVGKDGDLWIQTT